MGKGDFYQGPAALDSLRSLRADLAGASSREYVLSCFRTSTQVKELRGTPPPPQHFTEKNFI